jgi:hypothetical protein
MNIQTISIVVPTKGCVNQCPFCVSRMHDCPYENHFDAFQIEKRIKWAVMNGINTCIITGTGEALQNRAFLGNLWQVFKKMDYPFPNVELQTTGVMLEESKEAFFSNSNSNTPELYYPNIDLLKNLGVNTISLSVSDIFFDHLNSEIIGINPKLQFNLEKLISFLKKNEFNIRLSLNMLKHFDHVTPAGILRRCKELGANQVTFRKMYYEDGEDWVTKEGLWTKENKCSDKTLEKIRDYIQGTYVIKEGGRIPGNGIFLYKLPFGASVYSIEGMSVVIDDDCMSKENNEFLKYVILRENGKLYAQWDNEGSLIF